jgi:stage V sporulation protein G
MVEMEVSRMYRMEGEKSLKAFVDLAIDNSFIVKGLRIVSGKNGLFVGLPRQQGKDGKWYESVVAINEEVKNRLNEVVLKAYEE